MDPYLTCFGSDEEDNETKETDKKNNKNKKRQNKRKISENPTPTSKKEQKAKKIVKKKRKNYSTNNQKTEITLLNNNFVVPVERRVSIDISKIKLERKKYQKEDDYGNVEYKLKLCDVTKLRYEELKSGMNFRLHEGYGECFYEIGVEDNGNDLGITLEELTQTVSLLNLIANDLG